MTKLKLISHKTCPYVQRAVIALREKGVEFERVDIDLGNKPDWFLKISPLGKVPLLIVTNDGVENVIFESNVILEYLEETLEPKLHPVDALEKAQHRSWGEFGNGMMTDMFQLFGKKTDEDLDKALNALKAKFKHVENRLETRTGGSLFAGDQFSLVDAVYAPMFRFLTLLENQLDIDVLVDVPLTKAWHYTLRNRSSVMGAVDHNYMENSQVFLINQGGVLAQALEYKKSA